MTQSLSTLRFPDRPGGQYQVRYDKRKEGCDEGSEKRKQRRKSNWDVRPEVPKPKVPRSESGTHKEASQEQ